MTKEDIYKLGHLAAGILGFLFAALLIYTDLRAEMSYTEHARQGLYEAAATKYLHKGE